MKMQITEGTGIPARKRQRGSHGGRTMDKVKKAVKCIGVVAAYLALLWFSKLVEFWIFMSKITYEDLANCTWDWDAMPESFLFTFPYDLGIFRVLLITVLLCLLIHGRDFRIKREKSVLQCIRMHAGTFLLQGAALTGAVFGAIYARLDSRLSMLFSDSYFYFSGTHALMQTMQFTDPLANIWTIFSVLVDFWEIDFIMGLLAYVVYELLRMCFDRKLQHG